MCIEDVPSYGWTPRRHCLWKRENRLMLENQMNEMFFQEAVRFCMSFERTPHPELHEVTDGKRLGTCVEQEFREFLHVRHPFEDDGNSALGIDLPSFGADIKCTFANQPQSSSPFRDASQKIYGLGYHLIIFVYIRQSDRDLPLRFVNCTFVDKRRTADYTLTLRLREMLDDGANVEDIAALMRDRMLPGDDITLQRLAERVLRERPDQGYLTISNALQWRLQYKRVIGLGGLTPGVFNYVF